MKARTTVDSLPVLTIGDPGRVRRDSQYAESVVARLFEVLEDVDRFRGTGRVFLP